MLDFKKKIFELTIQQILKLTQVTRPKSGRWKFSSSIFKHQRNCLLILFHGIFFIDNKQNNFYLGFFKNSRNLLLVDDLDKVDFDFESIWRGEIFDIWKKSRLQNFLSKSVIPNLRKMKRKDLSDNFKTQGGLKNTLTVESFDFHAPSPRNFCQDILF